MKITKALEILSKRGPVTRKTLKRICKTAADFLFQHGFLASEENGNKTLYHLKWGG